MSDIEYLVGVSKRYEGLLTTHYKTEGRGLAEKAKNAKTRLPEDVFKALRHVAYMRNSVMHDSGVSGIDDRQTLDRMIDIADCHFRSINNHNQSTGQSTYWSYHGQSTSGFGSNFQKQGGNRSSNYDFSQPGVFLTVTRKLINSFKGIALKAKRNKAVTSKTTNSSTRASIKDIKGLHDVISGCRSQVQTMKNLPNDTLQLLRENRPAPESIIEAWTADTGKRFVMNDECVETVNKWLNTMTKANQICDKLGLNMRSTFYTDRAPGLMGEQKGSHPSKNVIKAVEIIDRQKGIRFIEYHTYKISNHLESIRVSTSILKLILNNNSLKARLTPTEYLIFCPSLEDYQAYKFKGTDGRYPIHPLTLSKLNTLDQNVFNKKHSSGSLLIDTWEKHHESVFIPSKEYIDRLNAFLKDAFISWYKVKVSESLFEVGNVSSTSKEINKPFYKEDKAAIKHIKSLLNGFLQKKLARVSNIGVDSESNYLLNLEVKVPNLNASLKVVTDKCTIKLLIKHDNGDK